MHSPLKKLSKKSVAALMAANHHVVIITGDHPLTACHVAGQLKITRKATLTLASTSANGQPERVVYTGSNNPCTKECVLLFDPETGEFTLEQLATKMNLKHQRAKVTDAPVATPLRNDIAKVWARRGGGECGPGRDPSPVVLLLRRPSRK